MQRIYHHHRVLAGNLPANFKNLCVSGGRSDVTDVTDICLLGLASPGESGPGEAGTANVSELTDDRRWPALERCCSVALTFVSWPSVPWTRKKASTAGWRTSTAWLSGVRASSVRHWPSASHRLSSDSCSPRFGSSGSGIGSAADTGEVNTERMKRRPRCRAY